MRCVKIHQVSISTTHGRGGHAPGGAYSGVRALQVGIAVQMRVGRRAGNKQRPSGLIGLANRTSGERVRNDRLAFEMVGPCSKTMGLCLITAASKGEVLGLR